MWRLAAMIILASLVVSVEIKRIPVVAVTGVVGGSAALPCEVAHPQDDAIFLLLWFREPLTTPIYRLDERSDQETHWSDEETVGSRVALEVSEMSAVLRITSLLPGDGALYTCRVDFRLQPTRTTRVNLTVVVPPAGVTILEEAPAGFQYDPSSASASSILGPYQEGDTVRLTCVSQGGKPRPSVLWYEGARLLDAIMESESAGNFERVSHGMSQPASSPKPLMMPSMLLGGQHPHELLPLRPLPLAALPNLRGKPIFLTHGRESVSSLDHSASRQGQRRPRGKLIQGPQRPMSEIRRQSYGTHNLGSSMSPSASVGDAFNTVTLGPPVFGGNPFNTLILGPLNRSHLLLELTCEASNTNLTKPVTAVVTLDMNLPPVSVQIRRPGDQPLRESETYEVTCVVVGARPPPTITWWSGYQRLIQVPDAVSTRYGSCG
ncbi:nephrin-like [Cherax quadricarinatus]|uniref:nephrin-like n=1 Tax=Cherax quadricarinatus TaxID=27406 RepID=UPI00387E4E64